jgi:hypothetical protein
MPDPFTQFVRSNLPPDAAPTPFTNPGTVGVPQVRRVIGQKSTPPKTFNVSISSTIAYYLSENNVESPPSDGWGDS